MSFNSDLNVRMPHMSSDETRKSSSDCKNLLGVQHGRRLSMSQSPWWNSSSLEALKLQKKRKDLEVTQRIQPWKAMKVLPLKRLKCLLEKGRWVLCFVRNWKKQRRTRLNVDTVTETLQALARFKSTLESSGASKSETEEKVKDYLKDNDIDLQWLQDNFILQVSFFIVTLTFRARKEGI